MPDDDDVLRLPEGFLLGCATAAHQVEGGTVNDWSVFERQPGRIKDGATSARATDHYTRYREDLASLAGLGQTAHRFSVEWSRVEPLEGRFDTAALRHYSDVVDACREHHLEPFVTLHHFTLPLWLADRGGVLAVDAPQRFARFAAACAETFGDRVRWWVTINEPVVLATLGYLFGEWPPAQRSVPSMFAAMRGTLRMHVAATAALRAVARRYRREALVSVAHHYRGMRPERPDSRLDRAAAAVPDLVFNRWFLLACMDGRMRPPVGTGRRLPGAAGSLDWLGLNYYSDDLVAFDIRSPARLFSRQHPDPALPVSSFGWSIDAEGLRRALVRMWELCRLPVVVTENGVADEDDELRPRFIVEHLAAVRRAVADGVDVGGYMHWTSVDNFEWAEGYSKRFGILALDPETMERRRKPSAEVYARICRAGGIPRSLAEQVGAAV